MENCFALFMVLGVYVTVFEDLLRPASIVTMQAYWLSPSMVNWMNLVIESCISVSRRVFVP